jgi:hypothetical protein
MGSLGNQTKATPQKNQQPLHTVSCILLVWVLWTCYRQCTEWTTERTPCIQRKVANQCNSCSRVVICKISQSVSTTNGRVKWSKQAKFHIRKYAHHCTLVLPYVHHSTNWNLKKWAPKQDIITGVLHSLSSSLNYIQASDKLQHCVLLTVSTSRLYRVCQWSHTSDTGYWHAWQTCWNPLLDSATWITSPRARRKSTPPPGGRKVVPAPCTLVWARNQFTYGIQCPHSISTCEFFVEDWNIPALSTG